jgi:hypothetical protein
MPKASGAGNRLSVPVERIHQAHRCAYVPTEGKGRGGPMSRDKEGGEMAESDRLVKARGVTMVIVRTESCHATVVSQLRAIAKRSVKVGVLKTNARTKLEMMSNNMSSPLQRLPDKT